MLGVWYDVGTIMGITCETCPDYISDSFLYSPVLVGTMDDGDDAYRLLLDLKYNPIISYPKSAAAP